MTKLAAASLVWGRIAASAGVLLGWLLAVYLYRDTHLTVLGMGASWLTLAHVLVPAGFFCLCLTNRRYGPAYALAQLVASFAVVIALTLLAGGSLNETLPQDAVPPMREAFAFGLAFFAASFVCIVVFEGTRGPHWWTAPLFGFLSAAIVFAVVFFPALHIGTGAVWLGHGLQYMALLAGEGLLLLLPYWALRRLVPPLSGFGGY